MSRIEDELRLIFDDEESLKTFLKMYKELKSFTKNKLGRRNDILLDVSYYKAEFSYLHKRISMKLKEKEAILYNSSYEKLSKDGKRPTNEMVKQQIILDTSYREIARMEAVSEKWMSIMTDISFTLSANNKILQLEVS